MFKNINSMITQSKHTSKTCQITKSAKLSESACSLATAFHSGNKNKKREEYSFFRLLFDKTIPAFHKND